MTESQTTNGLLDRQPDLLKSLRAVENAINAAGLPLRLLELMRLRVSRINGCTYCNVMHGNALRRDGVPDAHVAALDGWREADCFDTREKAALELSEALTALDNGHDGVAPHVEAAKQHFSLDELSVLTLAITMINQWNRLAIADNMHAEMAPA